MNGKKKKKQQRKQRRLAAKIASSAASLALPTMTMLTACTIPASSGVTQTPPPVGTAPTRRPPPPPPAARRPPPPPPAARRPPPPPAAEAQISDTQAFHRFLNAGYSYCDAEVLGAFWSVSPWEAKVGLGHKMAAGGDPNWAMSPARAQASSRHGNNEIVCDYENSDFTHADVDVLAAFWGVDPWTAKVKVSSSLSLGHAAILRADVAEARSLGY